MAARIILYRSENFCRQSLSRLDSLRLYAQQTAMKVQNTEKKFASTVWSSNLHIKEVKFIGSEKLRNSSPQEIVKNSELLKELNEAYKMMAEDEEVIEATQFCTESMLNRRAQE